MWRKGLQGTARFPRPVHDAGSFDVATGRGGLSRTSLVLSFLGLTALRDLTDHVHPAGVFTVPFRPFANHEKLEILYVDAFI